MTRDITRDMTTDERVKKWLEEPLELTPERRAEMLADLTRLRRLDERLEDVRRRIERLEIAHGIRESESTH